MGTPVTVIGAGSFGTSLALVCAQQSDVTLWARDPQMAEAIERDRHNPRYLSDIPLPASIRATADLAEALADAELVIFAVPSHSLRGVVGDAAPHLSHEAILVTAVKGIEYETGMLMHQVIEDVLHDDHHPRVVALSGPSFAAEIARKLPTVVTLACREETFAISVQASLSSEWFRCYSNRDITGVEVGGALKNVIALAVGIGEGQQMGQNSRAAMITRGLAEITRLGVRLGAEAPTFLGLSGMGDLLLTCTGDLSRNRRVGVELGRGRPLDEVVAEVGQVVEGVATTRAACRLAERLKVELPIAVMVRKVIDGELSPAEAGEALMTRQLRSEHD